MTEKVILLAVVILLFHEGSAWSQRTKLEPLNVSYAAHVSSHSPLWIAKEAGLFEKYGLNVNVIYVYGVLSVNALLAGDVHVAVASSSAAIAGAAKGAPITIVGAFGFIPFKLVARPSITSIQQLKKKTIGTSRPGASPDFALRRLLPKMGINPDQDVAIIPAGPGSKERMQVMLLGKIDATLASPWDISELAMQGQKVSVLADLPEWGIFTSGNAISTTPSFLKNYRHRVKSFLMAVSEAIWLGRKNKDVAFRVFRKYLNLDNPKLLEIHHRDVLLGSMYPKPYIKEEAVEFEIESLSATIPALKGRKPEEFMDSSLLREIEKEGFFEALQR
jgi:ABC-type nitrate/sulfonate/bicarbonate transport system substrate-binding protein